MMDQLIEKINNKYGEEATARRETEIVKETRGQEESKQKQSVQSGINLRERKQTQVQIKPNESLKPPAINNERRLSVQITPNLMS